MGISSTCMTLMNFFWPTNLKYKFQLPMFVLVVLFPKNLNFGFISLNLRRFKQSYLMKVADIQENETKTQVKNTKLSIIDCQ